jgi:hypothetical protein
MLQLRELDDRVPLADQLTEEVGPVILINTFQVAPEDADALLAAWAADAAHLKRQPGFIAVRDHDARRRLAGRARPAAPGPTPMAGQGPPGGPDEDSIEALFMTTLRTAAEEDRA